VRFGVLPDGRAVEAWRLGDGEGIAATVLTYGGRLAGLEVPVRGGGRRGVVLGYPDLAGYIADPSYQGAITGRFANRIAGARFILDGTEFRLPANLGPNTLHGGPVGFERAVWRAEPDGTALVLHHVSPDGDQGFPGELTVTVRYAVTADALTIDYTARTSRPTVLNLTNHAYFNLSGQADVLDHVVTIAAERYVEGDAEGIPSGRLAPVAGTALDFRAPHRIGDRIDSDDAPVRMRGGYDHCFVLADAPRATPAFAARVQAGGLTMETLTTEPGVQLYSGNVLGAPFGHRAALCLETQHFPDSPNHPGFPPTVLRPGETFRSTTIYRFPI
jgi:aldose 1-epimerase